VLRTIALLVPLLIVGTAVTGLLLINQMEGEISVQAFEDVILSWGHWGILASIGLMVLHSFVPFPAELVALANGMLYGPLWGTVITWIGAMLGAFLAFGLSRAFGRPFIEAIVARRHWQTLDDWTGQHAAQMVFLARFLPVISFNLVNYAAGLTKISWWTFAWTTGLGILPVTVLMAAMGDQVGKMPWHWWLALLAVVGIGWLGIQRWYRLAPRPGNHCQSNARSKSSFQAVLAFHLFSLTRVAGRGGNGRICLAAIEIIEDRHFTTAMLLAILTP
jgi:uncharacterized membrane protein YdjX (TVP38/TMEM64 family)